MSSVVHRTSCPDQGLKASSICGGTISMVTKKDLRVYEVCNFALRLLILLGDFQVSEETEDW